MAEEKSYKLAYTGSEVDEHLAWPAPIAGGGTGKTVVWESVTLTANTDNISPYSVNARFSPYLRLVFIRGSFKTKSAVNANTWFSVCNVPSEYRPSTYNPALAVSAPGGASGLLFRSGGSGWSDGDVCIRTLTDRAAGTSVDFSGWWYI